MLPTWGETDLASTSLAEIVTSEGDHWLSHTRHFLTCPLPDTITLRYHETATLVQQALSFKFDARGGPAHVRRLVELMLKRVPLGPAFLVNGRLCDGRHRILAAHEIGIELVPVALL